MEYSYSRIRKPSDRTRIAALKTIALSTLFATFSLGIVPAARGDLGMAPQLKELKIPRGGWEEYYLRVTNYGAETLPLEMVADAMDVSEAGVPFRARTGYERGCADWVTFTPPEFELEAEASQNVRVMVKAPKDAVGSYFAILTCRYTTEKTLELPTGGEGSTGLQFNVGVGTLLLTTIRSSRNTVVLEPESVTLDPGQISRTGPVTGGTDSPLAQWRVEVPVANDGNVYTIVRGDASIWTASGRLIARAPLVAGRGFVFPERRRLFIATGDRPLGDGSYLVRASVRSREGRMRSGSFPFTVVSGVAKSGSESEDLNSLLRASLPGFTLDDQYVDFDIQPGAHRTRGVRITSTSDDTLTLTPRLRDWDVDNQGTIVLLSNKEGIPARSCASWLFLSPDPLVIPPNQKKIAKIRVDAPEEMDGEYYAAVLFDFEDAKGNVPSEFQIPRTLFLSASSKQSAKPSAEIASVVKKSAGRKGCLFTVDLKNTGNVHCFAAGRLSVVTKEGDGVGDPVEFGGEGEFILPGNLRRFEVPWAGELGPGEYRANVTIEYYAEASSLHESVGFRVK